MMYWENPIIESVLRDDESDEILKEKKQRTLFVEKYSKSEKHNEEENAKWRYILHFFPLNEVEEEDDSLVIIREMKLFMDYTYRLATCGKNKSEKRFQCEFNFQAFTHKNSQSLNLNIKLLTRFIASKDPVCTKNIRRDFIEFGRKEITNLISSRIKIPDYVEYTMMKHVPNSAR